MPSSTPHPHSVQRPSMIPRPVQRPPLHPRPLQRPPLHPQPQQRRLPHLLPLQFLQLHPDPMIAAHIEFTRSHLMHLLHVQNCKRYYLRKEKKEGEMQMCMQQHPTKVVNVLAHMKICLEGIVCDFPLCLKSREILHHYKNCGRLHCQFCGLWLRTVTSKEEFESQIPEFLPKKWEFMLRLLGQERANPDIIHWNIEDDDYFRLMDFNVIKYVLNGNNASPGYKYRSLANGIRRQCQKKNISLTDIYPNDFDCSDEVLNHFKKLQRTRMEVTKDIESFL